VLSPFLFDFFNIIRPPSLLEEGLGGRVETDAGKIASSRDRFGPIGFRCTIRQFRRPKFTPVSYDMSTPIFLSITG
jgi:hypothetical protein